MCKPKEIEGLRLAAPPVASIFCRITPKFYQARLFWLNSKVEFAQPKFQGRKKFVGIPAVLESHDKVICITYNDNITRVLCLAPVMYPLIQNVM